MRKHLLCSAAIVVLLGAGTAEAADVAANPSPLNPNFYNWNGFYAGVVAGAAWGQFDPRTATVGDVYLNATQAAAVSAAGTQSIKPYGFVAGVEGGYCGGKCCTPTAFRA